MSAKRQRHQFQQRPGQNRLACQGCGEVPPAFDVRKKSLGLTPHYEWKCQTCGRVCKILESER